VPAPAAGAVQGGRLIVRVRRLFRDGALGSSPRRVFAAGLVCGVALVFAVRLIVNETRVPDLLISPLLQGDTSGRADAIVVLGAGIVSACVPNQNAVRRVLLAARLWRQQRAPVLVFTGGEADGTCPISVAMSRLAAEIGVPDAAMRLETTSTTTWENGEHSAAMLRGLGARRLLVVTDRLHMRRASGVFARHGFAIERASVPIYESHPDNVSMLFAGAREFAALTYYRARGWVAPDPGAGSTAARGDGGS
jgi:uncharacterized SAM-binding protein YcdF (DUF218 family)